MLKDGKVAYVIAAIACLLIAFSTTSTAQTPPRMLASKSLGPLAQSRVFWHLGNYSTRSEAEAEAAKVSHSTVVEALGKIWLLTVADATWRPRSGIRVAQVGPITVKIGESYTAHYMEGISNPGDRVPPHRHPGPEAWYTEAGEFCAETPEGKLQTHAGQGIVIPTDKNGWSTMSLIVTGTEIRRSLVLVLHNSERPWVDPKHDWKPRGLCQTTQSN